jgi:Pyruvate decarboxylase and related thiamine pyrophosphate-requiring enzymes
MTAQEISIIINENLDIIIFIVNNASYNIDGAIRGRNQVYNDIMPWNHSNILSTFGADKNHAAEEHVLCTNICRA